MSANAALSAARRRRGASSGTDSNQNEIIQQSQQQPQQPTRIHPTELLMDVCRRMGNVEREVPLIMERLREEILNQVLSNQEYNQNSVLNTVPEVPDLTDEVTELREKLEKIEQKIQNIEHDSGTKRRKNNN